jgi:hypothetical protein
MCCNPAKGRVEFEDGWLIKSSFITNDEMNACRLTRTKIQKQKKTSNFQFPISAQPGQFWFSSAGKDIWRSTGKSLFEES